MMSACLESRAWPRRRWWGAVGAIFAAQLGWIFWLSDYAPEKVRPPAPAPTLRLAGPNASEWLALGDPTAFALPHRNGFSGLAWLAVPKSPTYYFHWSEPLRWLPLEPPQFGGIFDRLIETNDLESPLNFTLREPEATIAQGLSPASGFEGSTLRITGRLAGRRLLTPVALPLQANSDLLTNSEVQVVVDAAGRVVSVPVLLTKSGKPQADDWALRQAATARFEPVGITGPARETKTAAPEPLSWGSMVFEWRTIPMADTNSAAESK